MSAAKLFVESLPHSRLARHLYWLVHLLMQLGLLSKVAVESGVCCVHVMNGHLIVNDDSGVSSYLILFAAANGNDNDDYQKDNSTNHSTRNSASHLSLCNLCSCWNVGRNNCCWRVVFRRYIV